MFINLLFAIFSPRRMKFLSRFSFTERKKTPLSTLDQISFLVLRFYRCTFFYHLFNLRILLFFLQTRVELFSFQELLLCLAYGIFNCFQNTCVVRDNTIAFSTVLTKSLSTCSRRTTFTIYTHCQSRQIELVFKVRNLLFECFVGQRMELTH